MFSFIPVLFEAVIYGVTSVFTPEFIRPRTLSQRASLSFDEIYRIGFQQLPHPHALVEHVWNELAHDLHVDPSKIMPTDLFSKPIRRDFNI